VTRAPLERDVSPNPYDHVPEDLSRALEDYVLVSDEGDLIDDPGRMDVLNLLFDQLDEIYDEPRLRSKWIAAHRNRGFTVGSGDDGSLHEGSLQVGHKGITVEVPDHLVNSLITQVLDRPRQERHEAFAATRDLVQNWFDLVLDGEKLLGHMLRTHSASSDLVGTSDEDLWAAHSTLHKKAREGKPGDWQKLKSAHVR
jgi:hypothetical protein